MSDAETEYRETVESLDWEDVQELYGVFDDLFTAMLVDDWDMVSRQRERMADVLGIETVKEIVREEYANEQ